jgi:hypothetical protein
MKSLLNFLSILLLMFISTAIFSVSFGLEVKEALGLTVISEAVMFIVSSKFGGNLSFTLVCGAISSSLTADCDTPVQSGTQDRIWIWNFNDIAGYTTNATNKMIVEAITMVATKTGFTLDGYNNSNMPNYTLVQGTFVNNWDHTVNAKIFNISAETKENLEGMKDGLFVVAYENVNKGEDGELAFEICGLDAGLKMTALTRDPNNADTQGAFDITFSTPKNKEKYMPRTIFDTDYATSLAIITDTLA